MKTCSYVNVWLDTLYYLVLHLIYECVECTSKLYAIMVSTCTTYHKIYDAFSIAN